MAIHRWRALVSDDLEAVNNLIRERVTSEIRLINDLSTHIFQSGGKRLRPLIVLLVARACGYQGIQHITLAALIEFFHTATLLHDDVIDESTLRRGQETAHEIWGSKASILVGDFLFIQYIQLIIDIENMAIMRLLTKMAHEAGCGEVKQLVNRHNAALTTAHYFEVIRAKTSVLFSAAAQSAALLSHSDEPTTQALLNYGLHLGNAYQLMDDTLDFCSDAQTIGKNIGDDLADGKATLPLIYAMQQGNAAQKQLIRDSIEQGSIEHLAEIIQIIHDTKAVKYTQDMAAKEIDQATTALQILPDSVYKEALIEIAQYAIIRDH